MLRRAVAEADLRALLMVVFHLSGERKWLQRPYLPGRDVRIIAPEDAGLGPAAQIAIRQAAVELLLARAGERPAVGDPGDALMLEMMRVCMAEDIAADYAPMMREELGFAARDAQWRQAPSVPRLAAWRVLIVGAGASGMILGARLKRLGIPFVIVEQAGEVGGTWRENRYPGCGVDTPNHAYSFSLGPRYPWSAYFSPRSEIQDYLCRTADELGLREHIRFNECVSQAHWDVAGRCWRVALRTAAGERQATANALVSAVGQFGVPHIPDLPGLAGYQGRAFHTSQWPDGLDLAGKRLAIVGTGASAMQIAPSIAQRVAQLDIYQRSPQWARPIPRYHDVLSDGQQWLLLNVPFYAAWFRFIMLWRYGDGLLPHLRKDPDWPHPERALNRVNDRHRQEMTDHLIRELGERQDLVPKCLPSYPPYGKRILLDNDWYRTLRQPNVELVTERIHGIAERGVITADGRLRPSDILVLSTGFRMTEMAARLNLSGAGGRDLRQVWGDDNATAYLGMTVPGFPNLFIMQGPSTGLGHGGSAICQAESQARYISALLARMIEDGIAAVEVRQQVHDAFVAEVDARHERMIWTHPGMSTYYRNRHGRVVSVTPFSLVEYWRMTHDPDLADYDLTLSAP
ncbi:MAG: NAD(P)/FAD-dependent oxidoreductase [Alphaproteobacteria bacterium]|nr:NAD(P)/FAD-dependent oxidoreductase [Alphaproteobacteria bacterium]